jgi:hypothetical protein
MFLEDLLGPDGTRRYRFGAGGNSKGDPDFLKDLRKRERR